MMLEALAEERRALTKRIAKKRAQVKRHDVNARLARFRAKQESEWAWQARAEVVKDTARREEIVRQIEALKEQANER